MSRKLGIDNSLHPDGFQFTRRWFLNRNQPTFREFVLPVWGGKPITYLEIGVFEAMSMVWMLQYVLTHPDSRSVGIDPWLQTRKLDHATMREVMIRAVHNTDPYKCQCDLIWGNSGEVLAKMLGRKGFYGIKKESVDLCMVDGDHRAFGMLMDAEDCLKLVRPGGWLLFDDVENDKEKQNHVKLGLEIFLQRNEGKVKRVFKHRYMEGYEKL